MINLEHAGGVATILLADPAVHNAMGPDWPADLERAVGQAQELRPRVMVVRGTGPSFCSGVNTKDYAAGRLGPEWFKAADRALLAVDRAQVPTVAVVHGYCLGGGLQLASACDIRIAAHSATLGLPTQAEGLIPGMSFLRLSRLVGTGWAADIILAGDLLSASKALKIGLVTREVADDLLDGEVGRLTAKLAQAPDRVTALSKKLLATARLDGYPRFQDELHDAMRQILPDSTPA